MFEVNAHGHLILKQFLKAVGASLYIGNNNSARILVSTEAQKFISLGKEQESYLKSLQKRLTTYFLFTESIDSVTTQE